MHYPVTSVWLTETWDIWQLLIFCNQLWKRNVQKGETLRNLRVKKKKKSTGHFEGIVKNMTASSKLNPSNEICFLLSLPTIRLSRVIPQKRKREESSSCLDIIHHTNKPAGFSRVLASIFDKPLNKPINIWLWLLAWDCKNNCVERLVHSRQTTRHSRWLAFATHES